MEEAKELQRLVDSLKQTVKTRRYRFAKGDECEICKIVSEVESWMECNKCCNEEMLKMKKEMLEETTSPYLLRMYLNSREPCYCPSKKHRGIRDTNTTHFPLIMKFESINTRPLPLPNELLLQVFSELPPTDLAFASRVNKTWRQFCSKEELWLAHCSHYLKEHMGVEWISLYHHASNQCLSVSLIPTQLEKSPIFIWKSMYCRIRQRLLHCGSCQKISPVNKATVWHYCPCEGETAICVECEMQREYRWKCCWCGELYSEFHFQQTE